MSKESTENNTVPTELPAYKSPASKFEGLYGTLMQKTSIGDENKNLQYLTNELFLAAQADLREDRKDPNFNRATNLGDNPTQSTKNLDIFYERLAFKMDKNVNDVKKELFGDNRYGAVTLKDREDLFNKRYKELKLELDKTRVFGVGKTGLQSAVTLFTNTARTIGKALVAIPVAIFGEADKPARKISTLGRIKDDLRNSLQNKTTLTRGGYEWSDFSPSKQLTDKKLWKKPGQGTTR